MKLRVCSGWDLVFAGGVAVACVLFGLPAISQVAPRPTNLCRAQEVSLLAGLILFAAVFIGVIYWLWLKTLPPRDDESA